MGGNTVKKDIQIGTAFDTAKRISKEPTRIRFTSFIPVECTYLFTPVCQKHLSTKTHIMNAIYDIKGAGGYFSALIMRSSNPTRPEQPQC